jgi:glycosyltransferase involved in cell wall biosynthesis
MKLDSKYDNTKEIMNIFITCFNKENYVIQTLNQIKLLESTVDYYNFQIIIIDDCSSDSTNKLVTNYIQTLPNYRIIKHKENQGLGGCVKTALAEIKSGKFMVLSGDNDLPFETVLNLIKTSLSNEFTIGYYTNSFTRGKFRHNLSMFYTKIINFIFKTNFKIVNSPAVYDLALFNGVELFSDRFAIIMEMNCIAQKKSTTFSEISIEINDPREKESNSIKFSTVFDIFKTIVHLKVNNF